MVLLGNVYDERSSASACIGRTLDHRVEIESRKWAPGCPTAWTDKLPKSVHDFWLHQRRHGGKGSGGSREKNIWGLAPHHLGGNNG